MMDFPRYCLLILFHMTMFDWLYPEQNSNQSLYLVIVMQSVVLSYNNYYYFRILLLYLEIFDLKISSDGKLKVLRWTILLICQWIINAS